MTTVKVAARGRWLLVSVLVLVAGLTGCGNDDTARESKPMTTAQAQEMLAREGPSGEGRFPGGTFTFGSAFDNSSSPFGDPKSLPGGKLGSASWDVYWHGHGDDRGAWGVGIDVFRTPGRAARALDEDEAFWCPAQRRAVDDVDDGGLADVRASSCHRAGSQGFYATLDAADESVVTHLTVGAATRPAAVAALRAVWPEIRDAVVRVRAALG